MSNIGADVLFNPVIFHEIGLFLPRAFVLDTVCKEWKAYRYLSGRYTLNFEAYIRNHRTKEWLMKRIRDLSKQLIIAVRQPRCIYDVHKELFESASELRVLAVLDKSFVLRATNVTDAAIFMELASLTEDLVVEFLRRNTNIDNLTIYSSSMEDARCLSHLSRLKELTLQATKVSSISSLRSLSQLRLLVISRSLVSDISSLIACTQLKILDLSYTRVTCLTPLRNMTFLEQLNLDFCPVQSVSVLRSLKSLEWLSAYSILATDLELNLGSLHRLTFLNVGRNRLQDVNFLTNLTNLTELKLYATGISDLSPVASLSQLRVLILSCNPEICDISPLVSLFELQQLGLDNCSIPLLAPLLGLRQVKLLSLGSPALLDFPILAHFRPLFSIYLTRLTGLDGVFLRKLRAPYLRLERCSVRNLHILQSDTGDQSVELIQVLDLDHGTTITAPRERPVFR